MIDEEYIRTEEELRNSIAGDFDFNYFIEAGAGAGKTKLVVDRITRQLSSGKYKPEEIVAITFTNKAAQELCDRIRGNLAGAASEYPENPVIREALRNIGRMQISTIHSFCHRILKENCFGAKLRLDFELLEEADATRSKEAFFKDWFNSNAALYKEFSDKCPVKISYRDLQDNFVKICDLPDQVCFRYEPVNRFNREAMETRKEELASNKQSVVEDYISAIDAELASRTEAGPLYGKKFNEEIQLFKSTPFRSSQIKDLYNAIVQKECPFRKRGDKNMGIIIPNPMKECFIAIGEAAAEKVSAMIGKITEAEQEQRAEEVAQINSLVLEFILKAREEYRKQKFNHYLSNDLLLQRTNSLLDDPEVVEKLRSMFKCIYLDESQDTDPVQNELIMKLCMKDGEFIAGMLFIVGDVKQSIYRFRDADYRIFNKTREVFREHTATCKVKSLNINNRSNFDLVEYFNEKVHVLPDGLIPEYKSMVARNDSRDCSVVHGVYKVEKNIPVREKDSEQVVRLIKRLVGREIICSFDPETKKLETRPVEYRDFLVLTSKAKDMDAYVDAFQDAGIPVRASVQYTPGNMAPLRRFAAVYRYLAMPYYKRAKEGILGIAQNNTSSKIEENIEQLRQWRKETAQKDGAGVIGWLLEHSELYLFDSEPLRGCDIKRYQMAIRQMVDQILSKGESNVLSISAALNDYISEDNVCEREIGYDKKENAVRFMNIHKAKGLEGNIVIIAQRNGEKDEISTYSEKNDRYQVVFRHTGDKAKEYYSAYALNQEIAAKAAEEQKKENARLEYVAVTRAREALIFMAPDVKKSQEPVFKNYADDTVKEFYDAFPAVGSEENDSGQEENGSLLHAKVPGKEIFEERRYKVSPSTMEVPREYIPKEKEETPEEDADGIFEDDREDTGVFEEAGENADTRRERPSGDVFGTVMHRAFELAVHEIRNGGSNWQLCISRAINENADDIDVRFGSCAGKEKKDYKDFLEKKLPEFAFFIGGIIKEADEVYTEFPFSLTVSGDELREVKAVLKLTEKMAGKLPADSEVDSKEVWINGKADLVVRKGTVTTIWDYKSDKDVKAEDIHNRYDNQMNLYKWVFEKYFGKTVEGKFYSLEIGEA